MTSPRTVLDGLDDAGAYPEIRRLRKAVGVGSWRPIAAMFTEFTDDHARSCAVKSAAEVAGSERLFRAAARSDGGTLARLLLAARNVELAYFALEFGERLSYEQVRVFRDRLARAEQELIDVCALEPDNVVAWELRVATAAGLEMDAGEAKRRWDQLTARNAQLFPAQFRRLQALCPKWGGSWEAALDFAREASAAATPGSLTPSLIPAVHLERWLSADCDVDLLRTKEVQREVADAAQKSVLHKDFQQVYRWVQAHGTFALYYSLLGQAKQAGAHFRAMNTLGSTYPWAYFAEPVAVLAAHRNAALEKG